MSNKVRKMVFSVLLGSLAVVVVAPPAQANRGNYVPPTQETQTPDEEETDVLGSVIEVQLPAVNDPEVDTSGGGVPAPLVPQTNPVSGDVATPAVATPDVAPASEAAPSLPRTGAVILPLARAGLAVLTLGLGLVMVARRRRAVLA